MTILCTTNPPHATPFWKIDETVYYFSDLPPLFRASHSGREIIIPVVDISMNGTSFQCFIPTSSGNGLVSSSTGALTVMGTMNGKYIYY